MKKIFLVFVLTLFSFAKVYAASGTGAATEYTVTMKKVELCEDSACATSYTVATKDMPVDIASASAGADIGSYAPTTGLTLGKTYTHLRVTISRTFTATGTVTAGSTNCATDGGTDMAAAQMLDAGTGTATSSSMYLVNEGGYGPSDGTRDGAIDAADNDIDISYASPTYASSMVVSGDTAAMIYALTSPYTVGLKSPTIRVVFNTSKALGAEDTACVMWLNEPYCEITIE